MEEQKNNQAEEKTLGGQDNKEQKLSYEQLNEICGQLYQQNQNLIKQVQQLNQTNMFKRLDYLFKVAELSMNKNDYSVFKFQEEFVFKCIAEIQEAMTVPEQEEEASEE